MPHVSREHRPHSRRGLSRPAERALWAALGGILGLFVGPEIGSDGPRAAAMGLIGGVAVGTLFAPQLTRGMPLFGVALGPVVTLTLMNLQRFLSSATVALPPVVRGRGAQNPTAPSLPYISTGVGVIASAVLAAVLLHALSRIIRGERGPLGRSLKSVAWICFWITLVTILISNFAPA